MAPTELERWDPNKRARHESFFNAVAIPVPRAQQAFELFANVEKDLYCIERIKDACVEENQILQRRVSEVCHAALQRSETIVEKDQRIKELVQNHRHVQQERDKLSTEKADIKSQLEARETAYRELQQQLDDSTRHHGKKIKKLQQALSSEQDNARQLGLDKSNLRDTVKVKEKELKENEADFTKWTTDLEEQLKELREASSEKDTRISNLNQEVARFMKAQELKERDLKDIQEAFAEESTRLCKQLKSAENTLAHIHKLSGLLRKAEEQSSGH